MSIEKELVFKLKDKGNNEQYILDVFQGMRDMDVKIDSKIVEVALKQYEARQKLKKKRFYKNKSKEELNKLLSKKLEEIETNNLNLVSVKMIKTGRIRYALDNYPFCSECSGFLERYSVKIKYLNGRNLPVSKLSNFIKYCPKCGDIDYYS